MNIKTKGITMPDGNTHVFIPPQANEYEFGGIKAKTKSTENQEIAIDFATGKLYAPETDTTLSKQGSPADAKAVGDRVANDINTHNSSATSHQDIRTDLTNVKQTLDKVKKTAYTDTFFKNFFAMQRTGKKYTVRFPLWETSQVSVGEKLDDNAGLVIEPSTLTEAGRDDYANIPLFKTYDCNVELVDGLPQITAMKGDPNFDPFEKDTFVLGMPYYQKTWTEGGYLYLSRSDTQHKGYVPCNESRKENGFRSFCLYGKYLASRNSKNVLGSYKDKVPVRSLFSYNNCVTEAKKRGNTYSFGSMAEYAYLQNTFMIKYAERDFNKILGGCFNYHHICKISVPESNVKRVVVAKAHADGFIVGSCVSVGDIGAETNDDRSNAKMHNIADNVRVLDVVEVDVNNKALVLDASEPFTTTATTRVVTMHWKSGFSDDIKGRDGAPCKLKSEISTMKYPAVLQGIELAVGGFENAGNCFMDIVDETHRDFYVCDDSKNLGTDINAVKKIYKKIPRQCTVAKTQAWQYGTEIFIDLENGANVITDAGKPGSGSSTGFCDGIYWDNATTGTREVLLLGHLWNASLRGLFFVSGDGRLWHAWWLILARLSLSVYRGEFA